MIAFLWGADNGDFRVGKVFLVILTDSDDLGDKVGGLRGFSLSRDEIRETSGGKTEHVIDSVYVDCVRKGQGEKRVKEDSLIEQKKV